MKSFIVFLIGVFAVLVLIFPSILPDFIPIIGALDEATATAVLLACARYFGWDLSQFLGRKNDGKKGEVVDVEPSSARKT